MELIQSIFYINILTISCLTLVKSPVIVLVLFIVTVLVFSLVLVYVLGLDLFGLILVLVYVGAIAVVFAFIVMMLNIRLLELSQRDFFIVTVGILILIILSVDFYKRWLHFFKLNAEKISIGMNIREFKNGKTGVTNTNVEGFSSILFNYAGIFLGLITLILFITMIGVIHLVFLEVIQTKRQDFINILIAGSDTLIYSKYIIGSFMVK